MKAKAEEPGLEGPPTPRRRPCPRADLRAGKPECTATPVLLVETWSSPALLCCTVASSGDEEMVWCSPLPLLPQG